jgi:hypothetical protein
MWCFSNCGFSRSSKAASRFDGNGAGIDAADRAVDVAVKVGTMQQGRDRTGLFGVRRAIAGLTVEGLAKFRADDLEARRNGFDAKVIGSRFGLR